MWFDCRISTDRDERTALLQDMEVTAAKFPDIEEEDIEKLSAYLESEVPNWEMEFGLDELLADLDMAETSMALSEGLNNTPPEIIFTTVPTALILVDGDPVFQEIEKTHYEKVLNTPFFIVKDTKKDVYYINGGTHWYTSENAADWEYTKKVPKKLEEIAEEALDTGEDGYATELVEEEAKLEFSYDGKPKFEPIEGTNMKYAVNTDKSVLLIENRYYCCDNAIWFESDSPTGPWIVSVVVPESVEEIPPESPVYNVKYVYIYESTPEVVYVGYTPGYVHSYAYHGCVYYGTGYYYQPWYGAYYYPRPVTYGYSVRWNPYTGWGFSFGVSYGWMTVGWGAPYYGYWGPAGYRHGHHYGYHHGYRAGYRHGYRAGYNAGNKPNYGRPTPYTTQNRASNNVYKNRSQGVKRTGDTHYDPKTGNQVGTADRSKPAAQPANRNNNVYTDKSGNVYRKDGDNWNKVDNNRPSTGESRPSTGESRPSTGESRPSTGESRPSTGDTRPSAGQQPSTGQTRPSTGQQPSTGQTRPSTGDTRPSTGQQPSTRQAQPNQSLNNSYNSRSRGAEKSNNYNQNRNSYQYSRPPSSSQGSRSSASPSRAPSGGGRSAAPRRR